MKEGLRRYWLALRQATLAYRAESLASMGRTAPAFEKLAKLYRISGEQMPSRNVPIEVNIMLAQVAIAEHLGPLSLAAAEVALAQLEEGRGRYSLPTRAYLTAFCRALVEYCLAWRDSDRFASGANDAIGSLDLGAVDIRIRQRFVLPTDGRFI